MGGSMSVRRAVGLEARADGGSGRSCMAAVHVAAEGGRKGKKTVVTATPGLCWWTGT